jgi:hypothetical protein
VGKGAEGRVGLFEELENVGPEDREELLLVYERTALGAAMAVVAVACPTAAAEAARTRNAASGYALASAEPAFLQRANTSSARLPGGYV